MSLSRGAEGQVFRAPTDNKGAINLDWGQHAPITMGDNDDSNKGTDSVDVPPTHRVVPARPKRKMEKTLLPLDYEPSKFSVICGRGKGSYQSDGNIHFRALVKSNLERYKEAPGRLEKSFIVSEVLNMIRESCPVGAFVKYEKGRWYDLDDTVCREKVGSLFRDFLHTEYKSSSKAKHAKKVAKKKGVDTKRKAPKQPAEAKPKPKPKSSPPAKVEKQPKPTPESPSIQQQTVVTAQTAQQQKEQKPQPKPAAIETDETLTFYDIDDLNLTKLEE